jgi:2-amino-4-hydroxy-6-hydroxymethyldihydropteridine diphosphokinase
MPCAYIGLGANLGDPSRQILAALAELDALPGTRLLRQSSLYRSAPLGYRDQPDFVNAVAQIDTSLEARALLDALLAIEQGLGRQRSFPDAPRTLDLDLLLYGDDVLDEAGLHVPHPRMHARAFVLAPLAEIAPALSIPGHGSIAALLAGCWDQAIARVEE